MTLETYMATIIANISNRGNKALLAELGYTPSDKDCGYRAGLRYLGLEQTAETDEIAYCMIYGKTMMPKVPAKPVQLSLFT